ncbi:uncharacterized protein [Amphiura filiformis]|uniref:uncharacterized protein n=1 Tax=Amphiura filiformis TaxID=82378 RepID=UPI003B213811
MRKASNYHYQSSLLQVQVKRKLHHRDGRLEKVSCLDFDSLVLALCAPETRCHQNKSLARAPTAKGTHTPITVMVGTHIITPTQIRKERTGIVTTMRQRAMMVQRFIVAQDQKGQRSMKTSLGIGRILTRSRLFLCCREISEMPLFGQLNPLLPCCC